MATKRSEVHVGDHWIARVSGHLVVVRIIEDLGMRDKWRGGVIVSEIHAGWNAVNTATHKYIHIKSAQRLRRKVSTGGTLDATLQIHPSEKWPAGSE